MQIGNILYQIIGIRLGMSHPPHIDLKPIAGTDHYSFKVFIITFEILQEMPHDLRIRGQMFA
jgi:hypothetical protein